MLLDGATYPLLQWGKVKSDASRQGLAQTEHPGTHR